MDDAFGSTDFLRLIAQHGLHVVLERGIPRGPLKKDRATLKVADGRNASLSTPSGYALSSVELPIAILIDFLRARFLREEGADEQGNSVFFLTADGRAQIQDQLQHS